MRRGNVTEARPICPVNLKADMALFDDLPPDLRHRLNYGSENWAAHGVVKIMDAHGAEVAVAVLDKVEGDMQSAYRKRIAA